MDPTERVDERIVKLEIQLAKLTSEPDRFSNEWYKQRLSAVRHIQEQLANAQASCSQQLSEMADLLTKLANNDASNAAKIGELMAVMAELQAKVQELSASVEKARDAYKELKNKVTK